MLNKSQRNTIEKLKKQTFFEVIIRMGLRIWVVIYQDGRQGP